MKIIIPSIDRAGLAGAAERLACWLNALVAFAATVAGETLAGMLGPGAWRATEHELRKLVLAHALRDLELPPIVLRTRRPDVAGPGFRIGVRACSDLRLLTRNVLPKLRGLSAVARLARIVHVLTHLDVYARRLVRRLRRRFVRVRVLAVAPPARAFVTCAPAPATLCADTS